MSGALGTIGGLLAPIAGGFLGSGLGELAGTAFGATANSLLNPTILADIGGALGGAGAGALANPRNRALGAGFGGVEGLLTGPGLTNWTGVSSLPAFGGAHVTPFLTSLGGGGWGRAPASTVPGGNLVATQTTQPGGQLVTAGNPNETGPATAGVLPGAPGSEAAAAGTLTEGAPADQITALRNALYTGTGTPQDLGLLAQLVAGTSKFAPGLLSAAAAPKATVATTPSAANVPAAQAGQPVPAGTPALNPATATGAGAGGVLGSGMSLPQLLALLGGGGALATQLGQGGAANMPNYGQFNALAQEAMGNTGMANALRSGVLPPGAEQMAEAGLQDAQAGIRARYASMGLSGSTMEGQDLARAQMQTEAQKYQMAQSAADFGMRNMNLADTIYGQIANYQLDQDKQLQDALAAFASAASGGSINYGQGGTGASQNIMSQAA